ncbi:MAG: Sir2 family NAD-dependent protein deacetylase [Planctomycetota bacterium]
MRAHVVVLTGAGVSADSGVATFRDAGGLWEGHRPEDVATEEAWHRDRATVWRFYQQRRAQLRTVEPNAAHVALATFGVRCERGAVRFTLVTQNVDDLHARAGSVVLPMHGELASLRCERCSRRVRDLEHVEHAKFLPCLACGHDALRPDIVWFGEVPFFLDEIDAAMRTCTHFLAIGTSGNVWPAAGLLGVARGRSAATSVQALEPPSNLSPRDRFVKGRAADQVPPMLEELARELGI